MKKKPERAKKPKVNSELRQWARGVSFTIAMGRRQVYTLISLHLSQEIPYPQQRIGDYHRHVRGFIQPVHCLIDRGLVVAHIWNDEKLKKRAEARDELKHGDLWQLTRAGELVIELLKEAGIYEEVAAELRASDRPRLRIA